MVYIGCPLSVGGARLAHCQRRGCARARHAGHIGMRAPEGSMRNARWYTHNGPRHASQIAIAFTGQFGNLHKGTLA